MPLLGLALEFVSSLRNYMLYCDPPKGRPTQSIQPELAPPIPLLGKLWLVFLIQHARFQHQIIYLSAHEAAVTVFRGADDWLAAHIETGVYDYGAAGPLTKGLDDFAVHRV